MARRVKVVRKKTDDPWVRSHWLSVISIGVSVVSVGLAGVGLSLKLPKSSPSPIMVAGLEKTASQYRFGQIRIDQDLKMDPRALAQALPIRQGETFNPDKMDSATDALAEAMGNIGYAFANVKARYETNPFDKTVDVRFDVSNGPRNYVEHVDSVGRGQFDKARIAKDVALIEALYRRAGRPTA